MNEAAFTALCQEQMTSLYRIALSILKRPADAQDAVQQALLNAWVHRNKVFAGHERGWLIRIVINECRSIQRQRMRVVPVEQVLDKLVTTPPESGLKEAMDALPDALRLPILLKYMLGMTEKEAALALHISQPALKSRLYRARKTLEKLLKEEVELG